MKSSYVRRLFIPSRLYFLLFIFFLVLPSFLIYLLKFYENLWINVSYLEYDKAASLFFRLTLLGFFSSLLGLLFINIFFKKNKFFNIKKIYKRVSYSEYQKDIKFLKSSGHSFIYLFYSLSLIFVFIYLYNIGFSKLFLLGSDLSPKEFRFSVTFEDENSGLNNLLQIARRVFMPFLVVFFFIKKNDVYNGSKFDNYAYYFIFFIFLISCIVTLDRAPLITFIVVFLYLLLIRSKFNFYFILLIPVFSIAMLFVGGSMTYIQHNITNFNFSDIFLSGFNFLWHRIWAAPSIVGIELSSHLLPEGAEKLNLKFSRLNVLFGGERIGSQGENSIYVGPVSFIGDAWRNFGYLGVFAVCFYLGLFFSILDFFNSRLLIPYSACLGILVITFVFYLTHGVFFSKGVFFQMIFILFYCLYNNFFLKYKVFL